MRRARARRPGPANRCRFHVHGARLQPSGLLERALRAPPPTTLGSAPPLDLWFIAGERLWQSPCHLPLRRRRLLVHRARGIGLPRPPRVVAREATTAWAKWTGRRQR